MKIINNSAYRITLLLYMGVLLLPFSFYYSYNATQNTLADTSIIRQLDKNGGEMLLLAQTTDPGKRNKIINRIDRNLIKISPWFSKNDNQVFYVGGHTLKKDYQHITSCWTKLKNNPIQETSQNCWNAVKSLSFTVDKMLLLKQNKIKNIFYINIILSTIFLLILIMTVRAYIQYQLKKHAIYDHETKLFNKKYFLSELKTSCAKYLRYKYPLSLVSISIENIEEYDKKNKQLLLKKFGTVMNSATRESDLASRYDTNHFAILLPDPEEVSAEKCQQRIENILMSYNFNIIPKPEFKFSAVHYNSKDSAEEFIKHSLAELG